jgi:hypothetical protein
VGPVEVAHRVVASDHVLPPVQQRRLRRRQGERVPHAPSVDRVHSAINELLAAGRAT